MTKLIYAIGDRLYFDRQAFYDWARQYGLSAAQFSPVLPAGNKETFNNLIEI